VSHCGDRSSSNAHCPIADWIRAGQAQYDDPRSRLYDWRFVNYLQFPVGSGRQTVSPGIMKTNFVITAMRMYDDGSLWITANVRYVVTYE
jgi:hypothetical protein